MAKIVFQAAVFTGVPVVPASATISVIDKSTDGYAQIWADYDGAATLPNPYNMTTNGLVRFYTNPGRYDITATVGGNSQTWYDVVQLDELSGSGLDAAAVQDVVGAMVSDNTEDGIGVTYDSTGRKLDFVVSTDYIKDSVPFAGTLICGNASTYTTVTPSGVIMATGSAGMPAQITGAEGLTLQSGGQISITASGGVEIQGMAVPESTTANDGDVLAFASGDLVFAAPGGLTLADVGGMVSGNTESGGITVTYQSGDDTLDFELQSMATATDTSVDGQIVRTFDTSKLFVGHGAGAAGGGLGTVGIGKDALKLATGSAVNNTAIGAYAGDALTVAAQTVLIGQQAGSNIVNGNLNVAIGYNALDSVSYDSNRGVAVGADTDAVLGAGDFVAVGYGASADNYCTAVGAGAVVGDRYGVAVGRNATIADTCTYAVAVGYNASVTAPGSGSVAVGANTGGNDVSIGNGATGSGPTGIAIGSGRDSGTGTGISIGVGATNTGLSGVAVGYSTSAEGGCVSIGYDAATTNKGVAIGYGASAGSFGVAIGDSATAASYETIIGNGNTNNTLIPGNVTIGAYTSGAGVTTTLDGALLQLLDSPAPNSALTDSICLHSTDASAGNTTLALHTEGSPVTTETPTATNATWTVQINGNFYKIPLITI